MAFIKNHPVVFSLGQAEHYILNFSESLKKLFIQGENRQGNENPDPPTVCHPHICTGWMCLDIGLYILNYYVLKLKFSTWNNIGL